jgi:epoxyqueuosine reductase
VKSQAVFPIGSREFAEAVKGEARHLGFCLAGITTPEPPTHLEVYKRWLAQGCQGEMHYLETERALERRGDPRLLLPGCRSIIVLGARYPSALAHSSATDGLRGKVAAYAWGSDYHELLPAQMEQLTAFIRELAGTAFAYRCVSDSAPLLERELAQRAGLGWIGKNTCLIHPKIGSFFLLAEILLDLELTSDPAFSADRCGACTRCIDACPTGCIGVRTLDARRCLSYLTIELKGAIPPELRSSIGEWVFGCDICQQVCPWNLRFANPNTARDNADLLPGLAARPGVPDPDLVEELGLDPAAFNQKFRRSPLQRAKRRGYGRNVAVALGNLAAAGTNSEQVEEAVSALARALAEDPEPLVRGHAAWALGRIGGAAAQLSLVRAALEEENETVQREIQRVLLI